MKPTIGMYVSPQHGEMKNLRKAWMKAEEMGASRLYVADHFNAQRMDTTNLTGGQITAAVPSQNFEATTVQAAMAATTTRAEIGCIVHAVGYRNPNLMADIARTIDHISGGRFILGLGSGYLQEDYDDYGYEYGTQKSRLQDLANALPVIKARFGKLNPKPLRKIPILIASMGEKIGMRIVVEHADIWHVFGPMDKIREKHARFLELCKEMGRDPATIEVAANCMPERLPDNDPDVMYRELGIKHLIGLTEGPDWDMGPLRELIQWRDALP